MTYGSFVKRLCTVGWAYTGLIAAALVIRKGAQLPDPEHAFGFACRELLGPGLVGLMVACVLAANMSTCSNFMVNTGALFTRNFYAKYFRPDATDAQLLWAGRISGLGLTLCGALFALSVRNVLHAFLFTETIAAFVGIAVLGGILWRRANRRGAFVSVAVAFGLYYFLNHAATGEWRLVYKWTAVPFAWAMLAGFGTLILVSLLTPPESKEQMDAFFDRLSRQSDAPPGPDGRSPLAAERGCDLVLVDITGWFARGRWKGFSGRYREDLLGFLLACATVAALVFLAWGIMQIR
jgi:Na+/proline symporter